MPTFCLSCDSLLVANTTANSFVYQCTSCDKLYPIDDKDTLVYEQDKSIQLTYSRILRTAIDDPVNPIVKKKCKKCSNNYVKQIRLNDANLRLINTCMGCKHQWIEGN